MPSLSSLARRRISQYLSLIHILNLTGSIPVEIIDILVTGEGTVDDGFFQPFDAAKYQITSEQAADGILYKGRLKDELVVATLVLQDGTDVYKRQEQESALDAVTAAMYPVNQLAVNVGDTFFANGLRYRVTGENTVSVISDKDGESYLPNGGIGMEFSTYSGEITIPSTVTDSGDGQEYRVTKIEMMAFRDLSLIHISSSAVDVICPGSISSSGCPSSQPPSR